MKILITSDNHLGYKETDPVRSDDSFGTFEEVLQIARDQQADLILQGGDLFDENKPSRNTYNKAVQLLRKYCSGQRRACLRTSVPLNIDDEKMAVEVPILSIHGNHDDPSGFNVVSPLDVLHSAGLVNYFGKHTNTDRITIEPVLVEKGPYRVALYGLGYIKGRLLHRAFKTGCVSYVRPEGEDWYSILMVHQDRVPRADEHLPEDFIDPFFDLVIYGHEHESLKFRHKNFDVIQCGSTVRTSLCDYERHDKYVYILDLAAAVPISRVRLRTVRPFLMETVRIDSEEPEMAIQTKLEEMIAKAKFGRGCIPNGSTGEVGLLEKSTAVAGCGKASPEESIAARSVAVAALPLLRLRAEVRSDAVVNKHRIQQFLGGAAANPTDVLRIVRRPARKAARAGQSEKKADICRIYGNILRDLDLSVLPCAGIVEALSDYVHKDAKDSFTSLLGESVDKIVDYIDYDNVVLEDLAKMIRHAKSDIYKAEQQRSPPEDEPFEIVFDEKDVEALCSGNSDSSVLQARSCGDGGRAGMQGPPSSASAASRPSTCQEFTFLEDQRAAMESRAMVEQLEQDPALKRSKSNDSDNDLFAFTDYVEK